MAIKVTKKGTKYAVVKDDSFYGGDWYIVDVTSGTKIKHYWDAASAKWDLEKLENGYNMPADFATKWNSDYGKPIDMPASLKKMQQQLLSPTPSKKKASKPIGSTSTSITGVIDKGAYKILKMDDGTFGVYVMATGESKLGLKSANGASKSGSIMAKKHAASVLSGMGVDSGSDAVDTLLKTYESRMRDMYSKASKEMAKKQASYMEKFHESQASMVDAIASGNVSLGDYATWLRTQNMTQEWYRDMVDSLSNDLVEVDKKAMDMLNGYVPRAYAENMNFATYQIEGDTSINTGFALYNESTVARLLSNPDGSLLPELPQPKVDALKDKTWSKQKINAAITQSILQGESVDAAAARLSRVVGMSANSAMRAARTALTGAQNLGRLDAGRRAKDMGIDLKKQWVATADSRTRYSHREVDRETVEIEDAFSNGCICPGDPSGPAHEVYNCFVGDTLVSTDTKIEHGYRRMYSGKLVTIKTASGVEFTCTPNHPILTASGWVGAEFLHEGDDLLITRGADAGRSRANPDVHHVMTSFETVHELLRMFSSERRGGLRVDFHGDGTASDIEIVGEERLLRVNGDASLGKGVAEFLLESSDTSSAAPSPLRKGFAGVVGASSGGLSRGDVCLAFLNGELFHSDVHGVGAIPMGNASIGKHTGHELSGTAYPIGDGLLGLTGEIRTDNIISVDISYTNGTHVYNLQTSGGYYFVSSKNTGNAIIAHNCRCAMRYVLPDHEYDDLPDTTKEGVAYDDWKNEHMTKLAAQKDKLQAQLDSANARINDLKKMLPNDEDFTSKFGTKIIGASSKLSDWSEDAVTKSEDFYFNKLKQAIANNNQYDVDWYKKRLAQLKEFDDAGRAYHEAHKMVEPQLKRWQDEADGIKEKLKKIAKASGGAGAYSADALANAYQFVDDPLSGREGMVEADNLLRSNIGDVWRNATKKQRNAAYIYTTNAYEHYNKPLNGFNHSYGNFVGYGMVDIDNEGYGPEIRELTMFLEQCDNQIDRWVRRGTSTGEMDTFFGFPTEGRFGRMTDDELQGLVGHSARIGSFLSTGNCVGDSSKPSEYSRGVYEGSTGFSGEVDVQIFVPKGAQSAYAVPFSAFDGGGGANWDGLSPQRQFRSENETILQRGGSYTCVGIERFGRKYLVKLELHPEDGYDTFQQ